MDGQCRCEPLCVRKGVPHGQTESRGTVLAIKLLSHSLSSLFLLQHAAATPLFREGGLVVCEGVCPMYTGQKIFDHTFSRCQNHCPDRFLPYPFSGPSLEKNGISAHDKSAVTAVTAHTTNPLSLTLDTDIRQADHRRRERCKTHSRRHIIKDHGLRARRHKYRGVPKGQRLHLQDFTGLDDGKPT